MRWLLVVGGVWCMAAGPLQAQQLRDARVAAQLPAGERATFTAVEIAPEEPAGAGPMIIGGLLIGAVGMAAGGVTGVQVAEAHCRNIYYCDLFGGIVGTLVGGTLAIPLGVHFAGQETSYKRKLALSTIVFLAGLVAAAPTEGVAVLLIPPAQLVTTVIAERRAQRPR